MLLHYTPHFSKHDQTFCLKLYLFSFVDELLCDYIIIKDLFSIYIF